MNFSMRKNDCAKKSCSSFKIFASIKPDLFMCSPKNISRDTDFRLRPIPETGDFRETTNSDKM